MRLRRRDVQTVEMQMGPMIDMVFLLLVFFMVTAKPTKPESDINMSLPGTFAQSESVNIPDEQVVSVKSNGLVIMNDQPVGEPGDNRLARLIQILGRFKTAADANKSEALVTLDVEDGARHQRIVDVLNACAEAGVTGVTFNDTSEG